MRCMMVLVLAAALTRAANVGSTQYVMARGDSVVVYENEVRRLYERPAFKVGPGERLTVLQKGRSCLRVSTPDGRTGWVGRALVVPVRASARFVFDPAGLPGDLDEPRLFYIPGDSSSPMGPVILDRSFSDALRDNADRETVERLSAR